MVRSVRLTFWVRGVTFNDPKQFLTDLPVIVISISKFVHTSVVSMKRNSLRVIRTSGCRLFWYNLYCVSGSHSRRIGFTYEFGDTGHESKKIAPHLVGLEVVYPFGVAKVPAELLLQIIKIDAVSHQGPHNFDVGIQRSKEFGRHDAKPGE